MKQYIFNLETTKIELHFEKPEYAALTAEQKAELKSAFLWSRTGSCWVSRAKEPNLWRSKQIAAKLGFTEEQRQGERMFAQYERGFEEYRKSAYFQDRAQTARTAADGAKYQDVAYLDRRIKECKKEIKAREKNIIHYEQTLYAIENGEKKKRIDGTPITAEVVNDWIKRELELVEKAMDKQAFLEACVDQCGGIRFGKDNIKIGYHVKVKSYGVAEVIGAGPQNITYRILTGGAKGMVLTAAYAEITEIVKAEEDRETHPFTVGERFTAEQYVQDGDSLKWERVRVTYEIVKASSKTIQLKPIDRDGKVVTRKPRKSYNGDWCFSIDDSYTNTFHKAAKVNEAS